jgi:hypothetical protein
MTSRELSPATCASRGTNSPAITNAELPVTAALILAWCGIAWARGKPTPRLPWWIWCATLIDAALIVADQFL